MLESEADRASLVENLGELFDIGGKSVYGIFDNAYLESLDFPGIQSTSPEILFRSTDVAGLVEGDPITRKCNGMGYITRVPEPDGTGMTLIRLQDG